MTLIQLRAALSAYADPGETDAVIGAAIYSFIDRWAMPVAVPVDDRLLLIIMGDDGKLGVGVLAGPDADVRAASMVHPAAVVRTAGCLLGLDGALRLL